MKWTMITGGNGFLGTNLTYKLLQQGNNVLAVDKNISAFPVEKNRKDRSARYHFFQYDIVQPFPENFLQRYPIQSIFHLACPTGVPNLELLSEEMILTCALGTRNVLETARQSHADVVFTSSSEVYGNPLVFPQNEEYTGNVSPIGIRSPYEEGKRFAESIITMYVKKYNVNAKIVRVFNTYGPFMSLSDTRVIPRFVQQLLQNHPLTIAGNGMQTRTFCYVDDLIEGLLLVQKKGKSGEVYNVGSNEETSIYTVALAILSLQQTQSNITFVPQFAHDHQRRLPNLNKVNALGWQPRVSLEEGLRRTLKWYGL